MDIVRSPSPLSNRDHRRSLFIIILALVVVAGFIVWQSFFKRTEPVKRDNLSREEYIIKLRQPVNSPQPPLDQSIIDRLSR